MKKTLLVLMFVCLSLSLVLAHPHIGKTVSTKIGDTEVSVRYFTSPATMSHVEEVAVGSFVSSRATLILGGSLSAGGSTLAAGEYLLGSVRKGSSDWVMVLYPGKLGRGESPDMSKLVKLDSSFSTDHGEAAHVSIDLEPGSGSMAGKVTLVWHFGNLHLAGSLS